MSRVFISSILSVVILMTGQPANAGEYKYKIHGNKIALFGKTVTPHIPLKASTPVDENDTLVSFTPSPNGNFVVVELNTAGQSEFFLYAKTPDKLVRLSFEHAPNTVIEWEDNSRFTASWGGMESSTTRLFDTNTPDKSRVFENLIQFLEQGRYYVSHVEGGIEVGCVRDCGSKPETFVLKNAEGKPISSWVFIDKITQKNHSLVIVVRDSSGKNVERTLHPRVLKQ